MNVKLKSLLKEEKTRLFQIAQLDDDGRHVNKYMGVFKASDAQDAREQAAKYHKNKQIVTTGYYEATETTTAKLNALKKKLEQDIKDQTDILN